MVTTSSREASINDPTWLTDIDIIDPNLNQLNDKPGQLDFGNQRAAYAAWTDGTPQRGLWWYQSCMSHGCGNATSTASYWRGWQADYVIDASGVKNRAMEWLTYLFRMRGELYYDTVGFFATAFTSEESFAQNILDLRSQGHCNIIVDDVIYFHEDPFQDGLIIHQRRYLRYCASLQSTTPRLMDRAHPCYPNAPRGARTGNGDGI